MFERSPQGVLLFATTTSPVSTQKPREALQRTRALASLGPSTPTAYVVTTSRIGGNNGFQ